MNDVKILRGWKDICSAAGGISEESARKLMRDEGFPVEVIAGKPMSTSRALQMWIEAKVVKTCQEENRPVRPHTTP